MTAPDHATHAPPRPYLGLSAPQIGDEEIEELLDAIRSGWLTTGPKVATFQSALEEYLHARHVRCLSSCTAGLDDRPAPVGNRTGRRGPCPQHDLRVVRQRRRARRRAPGARRLRSGDRPDRPRARRVARHIADPRGHAGAPRRLPGRPRRGQRVPRPPRDRRGRGRGARDRRPLAGPPGGLARQPHRLLLPRDEEHHDVRGRRPRRAGRGRRRARRPPLAARAQPLGLGAPRHQRAWRLRGRRAGLQVLDERHLRGRRHPPARAASTAGSRAAPSSPTTTTRRCATSRSRCRRGRRPTPATRTTSTSCASSPAPTARRSSSACRTAQHRHLRALQGDPPLRPLPLALRPATRRTCRWPPSCRRPR